MQRRDRTIKLFYDFDFLFWAIFAFGKNRAFRSSASYALHTLLRKVRLRRCYNPLSTGAHRGENRCFFIYFKYSDNKIGSLIFSNSLICSMFFFSMSLKSDSEKFGFITYFFSLLINMLEKKSFHF